MRRSFFDRGRNCLHLLFSKKSQPYHNLFFFSIPEYFVRTKKQAPSTSSRIGTILSAKVVTHLPHLVLSPTFPDQPMLVISSD